MATRDKESGMISGNSYTMLNDVKDSSVITSYTEPIPCQWSLLVIDGRKKQISVINGRTIVSHEQTKSEAAQVIDRNVRDASY